MQHGAFFAQVDGSFDFTYRHGISIEDLLNALFCAGAILISYGANLGKATPRLLLILHLNSSCCNVNYNNEIKEVAKLDYHQMVINIINLRSITQ